MAAKKAAKKRATRTAAVKVGAKAAAARARPAASRSAKAGAARSGKPVAAKSGKPVAAKSAQAAGKQKRAARPAPKAPAATARAEAVAGVAEGDRAPSFELADETGGPLSSGALAGQPYVLYFYPKDDTPGCTTEACGFRDALPEFEKLGVRVIGVSPDSCASHERFRAKYSLPFSLLSDAAKQLSSAYGAWALKKNYGREYMGVVRSTFLVDGAGVIRKAWRGVKVNGHVEQVQAAAAALG